MGVPRIRLDQLLVQRALVESREKAQRLVRAGAVRVGGQPATKPGHTFPEDCELTLDQPPRYVGRGGEKMEGALHHFPIELKGKIAIDVGASTGGFTDCLLQHGAALVYAVDVGKGQLHWKLRNDERVRVLEGVNAREMEPSWFAHTPVFACVDVSFISLTRILPALTHVLADGGECVTLIKPQFEAGREQVGKGGVVRDESVRQAVVESIRQFGEQSLGWCWLGYCASPILGPAGNQEFLAYWRKP